MNHFTTDLVQALVTKQDVTEIFRKHLEMAIYRLLETELTAFLDYEKYDRIGVNSGNSRNGGYVRTLHTEYGDLQLHEIVMGSLKSRLSLRINVPMTHLNPLSSTCSKRVWP